MAATPDPTIAQYRNAANLNARIALHQRFSTKAVDWQSWVFDHLVATRGQRFLELGAGPGTLWQENLARIPAAWAIMLTDRSPGMIAAAQESLGSRDGQFQFIVAEATALPCADASMDVVIANHMLYHVAQRELAFKAINRVLRPGGYFFAATNGMAHMQELGTLVGRFVPQIQQHFSAAVRPFSLENGAAQLTPWFTNIQLHSYTSSLAVTEAEPLVAFILSLSHNEEDNIAEADRAAMRALLEEEIATKRAIHITKATGMFVAQKSVD